MIGPALLFAGLAVLAAAVAGARAPRFWLCAMLAAAGAAAAAALSMLAGGPAWEWRAGFALCGEPIHLRLDALGALFLVLVAVVGGAGGMYSLEYWSERRHPCSSGAGRIWWSLMQASMALVVLSADGLHFLVAWELFAVCAYFLITLDRSRPEVRAAGWLYLAASHAATLCLVAFFAALAARTGGWELGPMRDRPDLAPLFWLALAGFGIKAGIFPLHVWLPSAHANAPSHVSAMMSGAAIKLGIYGLVRFSGWLPVPESAGWVLALLGAASAVLGVAFALGQHDLKRLLAYHSVENIGIILIGLGFGLIAGARASPAWGLVAVAGGLLHVWNHGLFKSLLFLGAGSAAEATGTREMSRLGGLWSRLPWTATLFGVGAAAISGLPPLNGFVSEWLVYLGLFDAVRARGVPAMAALGAAVALAVTGALALACFVKVVGVTFLGAPRTEAAARARECGWLMRLPMLALAVLCGALGLAPTLAWPAVARAAAAWNPAWSNLPPPPSIAALGTCQAALAAAALAGAWMLLRRSAANGVSRRQTWDCGYRAPAARIQYTAGSFAATVTEWFAWILRPRTHGGPPRESFPAGGFWERHTPETVLEFVVEPVGRAVLRFAHGSRRIQHGRLQAYLLYLLGGLAALAAVALLESNK